MLLLHQELFTCSIKVELKFIEKTEYKIKCTNGIYWSSFGNKFEISLDFVL